MSPGELHGDNDHSGPRLRPGFMQSTVGKGLRSDSNTAYLQPVASRPNLDIVLNTQVTKLIQTGSSDSAPVFTGVELGTSTDSTSTVHAYLLN